MTHLTGLGYSIFYPDRGMDVKIQGTFSYDFLQGFLFQGIFFQGVNLHSYPFQGGRMIIFFRYHLFLKNQTDKDSIPGDL